MKKIDLSSLPPGATLAYMEMRDPRAMELLHKLGALVPPYKSSDDVTVTLVAFLTGACLAGASLGVTEESFLESAKKAFNFVVKNMDKTKSTEGGK